MCKLAGLFLCLYDALKAYFVNCKKYLYKIRVDIESACIFVGLVRQSHKKFAIMNTNKKLTAAQMIRQILKDTFKGQKFSVTSDYNSIRISYKDGVSSKKVEEVTDPFVMGSFNGMEDIYEYDNRNSEIPQVKYIFVEREMSASIGESIAKDIHVDASTYQGSLQVYRAFQERSF